MRKRYLVTLTEDERAQLHELVHKGMRAAFVLTRAHILLQADAGATDFAAAPFTPPGEEAGRTLAFLATAARDA
jgi:hypothetical protein